MAEWVDASVEWIIGLAEQLRESALSKGGASSGHGLRSRRLARLVVGLIFAVNIFVFVSNIRWLLRDRLPSEPLFFSESTAGEALIEYPPVFDVDAQFGRSRYNPFVLKEGSATAREFIRDSVKRPVQPQYFNRAPTIVSVVSTELMAAVRNLVGSVHWWHPEMQIVLYLVGDLNDRHRSEISIWHQVQLVPLEAVVEPLIDDDELDFGMGPLFDLKRMMKAQQDAGQSMVLLEPDIKQALRKVLAVQPLVIYHAALQYNSIFYFDPSTYCSGWVDNVFKALLRDGSFLVQDETISGGCLSEAQGFTFNSTVFRKLLTPHLVCAAGGACPSALNLISEVPGVRNWWGLPPDDVPTLRCHSSTQAKIAVEPSFRNEVLDVEFDWMQDKYTKSSSKNGAVPQYDCRLLRDSNRYAVVFSTQIKATSALRTQTLEQAGSEGEKEPKKEGEEVTYGKDVIHIAIGIPSTTVGTQLVSPDSLPLVNLFLPSFLSSIDRVTALYRYTLYLGTDLGDTVYDDKKKINQVKRRMTTMIGDYPVDIKALRFPVSLSTTFVWNGLFEEAVRDGADYFLAVHDDTEFYPLSGKYWTDVLIGSLQNNALWSNLGVAGPLDMRNPKLITHMFVHRTHHEIFGSLYPETLSNTEHDNWISRVYGYKNTFLHTGFQVYNTHRFTGRSKLCSTGDASVPRAIQLGLEKLKIWLGKQLGGFSNEVLIASMLE